MEPSVTRRKFVQAMGVGAGSAAGLAPFAAQASDGPKEAVKIVAVACSPRPGKTTAQALGICLEAAKAVDPQRIETELIDLAEMEIPAYLAAGIPLKPGDQDDFPDVAEKLSDRNVMAIVVGSPVYFRSPTALCKAFIDRCFALRRGRFALSDKVGGAVAVGGARNGGQELTLQVIQSAMMCQEMIIVGDGRPTAHAGASVWNIGNDDISGDEIGVATLKNLGRRVAEVALKREPSDA